METLRVIPMRKNLWALDEVGKTIMYLINGKNKALLIDTGFGLSDLKKIIKKLCGEKEIIVVNSHGHIDHDSGNNQFPEVYVGRYDEPDTHSELSEEEKERVKNTFFQEFFSQGGSIENWNPGPAKRVLPIQEGDCFNLGDYCLKVLEIPGHSLGSIALYEEKERWLFTGDSMLTWEVWGQLDHSAALRIYGESMEKLAAIQDNISAVFPAHWEEKRNPGGLKAYELPPEVLSMYTEGIKKILEGKADSVDYPFRRWNEVEGHMMKCVYFPIGGIAFDPDRIGK